MDNLNIFEYAAENRLRFPYKGQISVEDLYQLTDEQLNSIYKSLCAERESVTGESLFASNDVPMEVQVKIEIVKKVFSVKREKQRERLEAIKKTEKKRKLLAAIAEKEDAELGKKSIEELKKLVEEMDA